MRDENLTPGVFYSEYTRREHQKQKGPSSCESGLCFQYLRRPTLAYGEPIGPSALEGLTTKASHAHLTPDHPFGINTFFDMALEWKLI